MRAAIQIKAKASPVAITSGPRRVPLHVLAPTRASNQDSPSLQIAIQSHHLTTHASQTKATGVQPLAG